MPRSRLPLAGALAATAVSASLLGLLLAAAPAAHAQFVGQNFQTIDPPFASPFGVSEAYGISNNGTIAGDYLAADNATINGFLYQSGNFTSVQYPDQVGTTGNYTILTTVNSSGAATGYYDAFDAQGQFVSETYFLRSSAGVYSTPMYPGFSTTLLVSINDAGLVAGQYLDANNLNHSFIYNTNTSTYAAVPDAGGATGNTFLQYVSNTGVLVGSTNTVDLGPTSGFLYRNGAYTTFNLPGAVETRFNGINAAGIVSGRYLDSNGLSHGLLYNSNNGFFSTLDFPGASETFLRQVSINDSNQVAGSYTTQDGTIHSFTATAASAPEPSALALLAMGGGLGGSTALVRRRRGDSGGKKAI